MKGHPRVEITPRADADVDECFGYIASDNVDAAGRFVDAVYVEFSKLALHPGLCPVRPVFNSRLRGLRSWPVKGFRNYLIFYRRIKGGIEVIRVLHGARDIERILREP